MLSNDRGVALGIILITSVVFGIAAFGLLTLALSRARVGGFLGQERIRAQYAAEAGLVKVMSRLWQNPAEPGPWSYPLDTDNNGLNDTTVNVTRTPSGSLSTLAAKVTW